MEIIRCHDDQTVSSCPEQVKAFHGSFGVGRGNTDLTWNSNDSRWPISGSARRMNWTNRFLSQQGLVRFPPPDSIRGHIASKHVLLCRFRQDCCPACKKLQHEQMVALQEYQSKSGMNNLGLTHAVPCKSEAVKQSLGPKIMSAFVCVCNIVVACMSYTSLKAGLSNPQWVPLTRAIFCKFVSRKFLRLRGRAWSHGGTRSGGLTWPAPRSACRLPAASRGPAIAMVSY